MDLRESATRGGVRHPWETARASFLLALLGRHGRLAATKVLDLGSGDGYFATRLLEALPEAARITCVDAAYDRTTVDRLGLPGAVDARSTLPEGTFGLVLALDVAEHVEDDAGLVRELRARTAPDGRLLFTVPAWPILFSDHDRALLHHRRYTHAAARRLLASNGFRVVEDGGFFHTLLAPRSVAVGLERLGRRGRTSGDNAETAWQGGERLGSIVDAVLRGEQRLTHALGRRGYAVPGLSYYAIAAPA